MYHEGYTYPDVSQMYLTCSVTFQENTCILTFCMYFTRIPKESNIHFGIHIRYIKTHVSCALPWCHTGYISRYIRIRVSWTLDITIHLMVHQDTHRDTKSRYMYNLGRVMTRYVCEMQDTCEIHVSARVIKIHAGYIRDT
jgi:hypothetical protein